MSVDETAAVVVEWLEASGLDWEATGDHSFVVNLPGERKQRTATSISVGQHFVTVQAFVARHPDENAVNLYRWLLERNRRMYAVAYCLDSLGDVYLSGRLPLHSIEFSVRCLTTPTARSTPFSSWGSHRRFGASGRGGCHAVSRRATSKHSDTSPTPMRYEPPRAKTPRKSDRAGW